MAGPTIDAEGLTHYRNFGQRWSPRCLGYRRDSEVIPLKDWLTHHMLLCCTKSHRDPHRLRGRLATCYWLVVRSRRKYCQVHGYGCNIRFRRDIRASLLEPSSRNQPSMLDLRPIRAIWKLLVDEIRRRFAPAPEGKLAGMPRSLLERCRRHGRIARYPDRHTTHNDQPVRSRKGSPSCRAGSGYRQATIDHGWSSDQKPVSMSPSCGTRLIKVVVAHRGRRFSLREEGAGGRWSGDTNPNAR